MSINILEVTHPSTLTKIRIFMQGDTAYQETKEELSRRGYRIMGTPQVLSASSKDAALAAIEAYLPLE